MVAVKYATFEVKGIRPFLIVRNYAAYRTRKPMPRIVRQHSYLISSRFNVQMDVTCRLPPMSYA